jgi:hypothetical protein
LSGNGGGLTAAFLSTLRRMNTKYAWRVLRNGAPTSLILHLGDDADSQTAALVIQSAERNGVELEPLYPPDLEPEERPAA